MDQCLRCHSPQVVHGYVTCPRRHVTAFRPHSLRLFSFTFFGGPDLPKESLACLNCGLVWTEVPADKLREFVRKHCDERTNPPVQQVVQEENQREQARQEAEAKYEGQRCVRCEAPIPTGVVLCPICKWAQPKYEAR